MNENKKPIISTKKYIKRCLVCGDEFETNIKKKITCGQKCSSRLHHIKENKRYKGISVDSHISLFMLAERDNNICQLCGRPVNWEDKHINKDGYLVHGNDYPSIDHIQPIAKGGLHSWDNIQLAHRRCNSLKREDKNGKSRN